MRSHTLKKAALLDTRLLETEFGGCQVNGARSRVSVRLGDQCRIFLISENSIIYMVVAPTEFGVSIIVVQQIIPTSS